MWLGLGVAVGAGAPSVTEVSIIDCLPFVSVAVVRDALSGCGDAAATQNMHAKGSGGSIPVGGRIVQSYAKAAIGALATGIHR